MCGLVFNCVGVYSCFLMSWGALLAVFVVNMAWFVVCWDDGICSEMVDAVVWLGVLWGDSFLSWVWLDLGSRYLG